MAEITLSQVPKGIRNLFNKGYSALESGHYDNAIDLLLMCVEMSPQFFQARKALRAAEMAKSHKKKGGLSTTLAPLTGALSSMKVRGLIKKDARKAVLEAEKLIRSSPTHVPFALLFADAAVAADLPEAATMTLDAVLKENPKHGDLLIHLGKLYQELKNHAAAKECFEQLVELRPNNGDALKLYKDAMANASMDEGRWEQVADSGGSYQEMLANKDEAKSLERKNRAVTDTDDNAAMIAELKHKIEAEPENLNYRREMARLQRQEKQFDDAIETIKGAIEISSSDPELDRMMAETKTQAYNAQIESLQASGDEAAAAELQTECNQFVFDNLQERVQRYPNDAHLRYELGLIYFNNEYLDEAIQQFQLAQKSPKDRTMALFYLGLALKSKSLYDMALVQLDEAAQSIPRMDKTKLDVLYEMGTVQELQGDMEGALENYKKVYSTDISYKDVAERVEKAYSAKAKDGGAS